MSDNTLENDFQYMSSLDCLTDVAPNDKSDRWVSMIGDDSVFMVSATRRWIDDIILPNSGMVTK